MQTRESGPQLGFEGNLKPALLVKPDLARYSRQHLMADMDSSVDPVGSATRSTARLPLLLLPFLRGPPLLEPAGWATPRSGDALAAGR